jgi:hypothetical protein
MSTSPIHLSAQALSHNQRVKIFPRQIIVSVILPLLLYLLNDNTPTRLSCRADNTSVYSR